MWVNTGTNVLMKTLMRFGLQCKQLDVFHSEKKGSASGLQQMIAWALQPLVGGAERSVRVELNWLVLIGQYQGRPTIGCCGAETLELLESELADEICRRPTHTHIHTANVLHITVYTLTLLCPDFSGFVCTRFFFPIRDFPPDTDCAWSQYPKHTKSHSPHTF